MAKRRTPKDKNANADANTFLDEEIDLQEQYGKAEEFINNNKNMVLGVLGAALIIICGFLAFNSVYIPGQEADARSQMFVAEQYFAKDSFQLALNGNDNYPGFLDIIGDYSGMTQTANLAQYYAGVCYLNLGDYESAANHLSNFSGSDEIVSSMAIGALGDAYSEQGNLDKGISYYKKAANNSANEYTSAMFLMKAAAAYESKGEAKSAKGLYEQVKKNYPDSNQTKDIDKYIARAEANL
ncbi:MAG: tetratricopeptide repeat protein [Chitinophagales bacterium]